MLKGFFYALFMAVSFVRADEEDPKNPMKFKLPYELPDQNQDGYSDNQDFQRAFKSLNLTRYEISQVFDVCDYQRRGKVNQKEWNDFYIAFITHFENSDNEPRDGVLNEDEVKKALEDIPEFIDMISASKRGNYLQEIMETLTSRTQITRQEGALSLNLNEYVFLRRAAIAWKQCSAQSGFMVKAQIQTCASQIMLSNNVRFSDNQQQTFFHVLAQYSRADEKAGDSYRFLAFLSIYHKFDMFQRIGQNQLNSGNLNWRQLLNAAQDSEGPSQKLTMEVLDTIFSKMKQNLEFTGLDFKQFFLLMQSIDNVYIYGKTETGYLTLDEWQTMMKDNIYRADLLDNVDDCYVDKEEADEKEVKTDHWARQQQLLTRHRKRRFARVKTMFKKLPESNESRQYSFQIHDLNEDGKMHGGELFLFTKFSIFFKQLTRNGVHLIYQRNFEFDTATQTGNFEMALFKEEYYQFEELQKYMRARARTNDLGLNFIQFSSWFTHATHFVGQGQQAESSETIPFPAFKKVLEYLGFKLHRTDIENHVTFSLEQPRPLPAQKFDLQAYMRDGAYINYAEAFKENLTRYSKTFMMQQFFGVPKTK